MSILPNIRTSKSNTWACHVLVQLFIIWRFIYLQGKQYRWHRCHGLSYLACLLIRYTFRVLCVLESCLEFPINIFAFYIYIFVGIIFSRVCLNIYWLYILQHWGFCNLFSIWCATKVYEKLNKQTLWIWKFVWT